MQEMKSEWQFEYAFSAIDGSHVPIKCLPGGAQAMKQYRNFKIFYSVTLLALVDTKYWFIWASLGALGNTIHYGQTLSVNVLSEAAAKPNNYIVIPQFILGDGAFPIRSFFKTLQWCCAIREKKIF